jgi:DNA-binding Lrp family transcriptional regulator
MTADQPDPFVIVPRYVIIEAPAQIGVYCAVRMYADYETGECFPAIDTIAELLHLSRSTVQRHIAHLVDIGALSKRRTGRSNVYRFPPHRWLFTDPSDRSPMTHQMSHQRATNKNQLPITIQQEVDRPRDLLWECFVEIHGEPATKGERGKYNATVKKLRDADVTPDEYPMLVAAFTTKHDGLQPGVATVAERIGELRHFVQRGPIRGMDLDTLEREQRFNELRREDDDDTGRLENGRR